MLCIAIQYAEALRPLRGHIKNPLIPNRLVGGRVCTGKSLALLKRTAIKRILGRHLRQNFNHQKLNQGLNAMVLLRGRSSLRMPPEPGLAVEAVEGEGKKKSKLPSFSFYFPCLLPPRPRASCHLTFLRGVHTQPGPVDIRH